MSETRFSLLEIDDVPAAPQAKPAAPAPAPQPEPAAPAPLPIIPTPVGMKTPHGVEMSPRMARCYGWLRSRGIPLTPFSTDDSVQRWAPNVDKAIAAVEAMPDGVEHRADLLADLRAVRSRTPDQRAAGTVGAETEKPKAAHEELVAVGKADETTGAVVYWTLSGDLDLAKMSTAWNEAGLDPEWMPAPPSAASALRRAAKDRQSRSTLVRQHPKGGWAFVHESAVGTLEYSVGTRAFLDGPAKDQLKFVDPNDEPVESHLTGEVRLAFDRARVSVDGVDMSAWLIWLARKLEAVSLRATGGVYFIPRDSMDLFHKAKAAVAGASSHRIFEIPALKSADAIAAVMDAVQREIDDLAEQLRGELAEGMGPRAVRTRTETLQALSAKVESYERLLGAPMTGARGTITKLHGELAKTGARGAFLEVD